MRYLILLALLAAVECRSVVKPVNQPRDVALVKYMIDTIQKNGDSESNSALKAMLYESLGLKPHTSPAGSVVTPGAANAVTTNPADGPLVQIVLNINDAPSKPKPPARPPTPPSPPSRPPPPLKPTPQKPEEVQVTENETVIVDNGNESENVEENVNVAEVDSSSSESSSSESEESVEEGSGSDEYEYTTEDGEEVDSVTESGVEDVESATTEANVVIVQKPEEVDEIEEEYITVPETEGAHESEDLEETETATEQLVELQPPTQIVQQTTTEQAPPEDSTTNAQVIQVKPTTESVVEQETTTAQAEPTTELDVPTEAAQDLETESTVSAGQPDLGTTTEQVVEPEPSTPEPQKPTTEQVPEPTTTEAQEATTEADSSDVFGVTPFFKKLFSWFKTNHYGSLTG